MISLIRIFTTFFTILLCLGCEKPISEPETIDPIYKDLVSTIEKKKSELEAQMKKKEELEKKMALAQPRTQEVRAIKKEYSTCIQNIQNLNQSIQFYQIRAERRKFTSRMTYQIAYRTKKPWPDPSEYEKYQLNKRLNEASREWNDRVPKLTDRYPSSKNPQPQSKESGQKSGEDVEKKAEEGKSGGH